MYTSSRAIKRKNVDGPGPRPYEAYNNHLCVLVCDGHALVEFLRAMVQSPLVLFVLII